jgi:hypothetical protein
LPAEPAELAGPYHRFFVSRNELRIVPLATTDETAGADWTAAAAGRGPSLVQ